MAKQNKEVGRTYRGVDSEQRKKNRRDAFIGAGIELFGTKGYRACSVKMVCDKVNLTERYFYESFSNREALLSAVFQYLALQLDRKLRTVIELPDIEPTERVRRLLDAFFKYVRDGQRGRVLIFEILGVSPEIDVVYRTAMRTMAALIEQPSLNLFENDSKTSAQSRHILSTGLVGAMVQLANSWILENYKISRKMMVENTLELFKALADWEHKKSNRSGC